MLSSSNISSKKSVHNNKNTKTIIINIPPLNSNPQSPKNQERLSSNLGITIPP